MLTTRRELLVAGVLAGVAGCTAAGRAPSDSGEDPLRLTARPDPSTALALQPGTTPLPLRSGRGGLLHVPPGRFAAWSSSCTAPAGPPSTGCPCCGGRPTGAAWSC